MHEERNLNRENFKVEMTRFFMEWDYSKGPMYPWPKNEILDIVAAIKYKIQQFTPHIEYVGHDTFGETIIFAFSWEGEGVNVEININPVLDEMKNKFRAAFRWR